MTPTLRILYYMGLFAASIGVPFAVQWCDKRWLLRERQRERAWNAASWGSALYGFSFLSMLAWCWVTRSDWPAWRARSLPYAIARSVLLLVIGALVTALVVTVVGALNVGLAFVCGVEIKD